MKKTNVRPIDDWFTFRNRFDKTIEFEFQDVLALDVAVNCSGIECNGVLITHDDDYEKIALPVRVNTEKGEVVSIDVLEYND